MSKKEANIIQGYQVPTFTPTGRGIIIPSMDHILLEVEDLNNDESNELLETQEDLSAKDFITTVLVVGPAVDDKLIVPGARVQIIPHEGLWFTPLDIDGEKYFLIKENLIAGVYS